MDAETELKPCPNPWCKSDLPYVYAGLSGQFRVMCACGIEGPWASTEAEAIAAWNTRPTVEAPAGVVIVPIGAGEIVSNWGSYYDLPAVFLQPTPNGPGELGAKVERDKDYRRDQVPPGTVILQFKGPPDVVLSDIRSALGAYRPANTQPQGEVGELVERVHRDIIPAPLKADIIAALTAQAAEIAAMRLQGQAEGKAAVISWLRERLAMKPTPMFAEAAAMLATLFEQSEQPAALLEAEAVS